VAAPALGMYCESCRTGRPRWALQLKTAEQETITMQSNNVINDFADFCGSRAIDPEETLEILNAQAWKGAKEDLTPFTDEQLQEITRLTKLIDGEPTDEQLDAIVRSVMTSSN
jgi:hypothetical protein